MKITETKSTLARLLAKENINVTSTAKSTAYFDIKNRTLALPKWKDRGISVMDMLIGHEVGHALYTPADAVEKFNEKCPGTPFDVCNIVEDIRIERLIQSTYPGLPRLFKEAYNELVEADFFGIGDKDVNKMKFIDRLNLRGKIGTISDIPLSDEEEVIFKKCVAAETFEDVLEVCAEIAEKMKKEPEPENDDSDEDNEETSTDEGSDDTSDENDSGGENDSEDESESDDGTEAEAEKSEEDEENFDNEAEASSSDIESDEGAEEAEGDETVADGESAEEVNKELVSETQENFDRSLEEEVQTSKELGYNTMILPRRESVYKNICDYKTLIVDREKAEATASAKEWYPEYKNKAEDLRKKTKKKAAVLAREFERRKAAYQYSRSTEARTGVIDVNKLHSYKITDEIFLSKSILANAKSHGMVFLLDYSGSMGGVMSDVIEQTLNLVEFCRMVGIPYDVYSFTSVWRHGINKKDYSPAPNEVDLKDTLILHHLSSEMSKSDFKKASDNMWLQVALHGSRHLVSAPYESLGGTPLDSTLTAMFTVVKDFIAKNKTQKTMFVTLTDGDSSRVSFREPGEYDSWTSKTRFKFGNAVHEINNYSATSELIKVMGEIPTVTTIGFYLATNRREVNRELYNFGHDQSKLKKTLKKDGHVEGGNIKGYDSYFLLNDVSIDDEDFSTKDIDEDIASSKRAQTKLAKQFSAHHAGNKKTRVLMTKIATKVA